jgi:hypothetical protein
MAVELHNILDSVVYTSQGTALHSDCLNHRERNPLAKTNFKINQQSATKRLSYINMLAVKVGVFSFSSNFFCRNFLSSHAATLFPKISHVSSFHRTTWSSQFFAVKISPKSRYLLDTQKSHKNFFLSLSHKFWSLNFFPILRTRDSVINAHWNCANKPLRNNRSAE